MHASSYMLMNRLLDKIAGHPLLEIPLRPSPRVLDIGSRDINGTYRELVEERGWRYVGLDQQDGPNVDVVGHVYDRETFRIAFPGDAGKFDVVISGQQLEHDRAPWLTVQNAVEFTRCRFMLLVAPFLFPIHHEPDYWRFTGAGLAALLERAGLTVAERGEVAADAFAIGHVPRE